MSVTDVPTAAPSMEKSDASQAGLVRSVWDDQALPFEVATEMTTDVTFWLPLSLFVTE